VLQMVNHGLVVAPLFFIVALLAERTGSDDIREMGGIAFRAPVLAALFLIAALANLAMPGSSNFVGEFFILIGLFNVKIVYSIVAFTGVALASVYTLRMFIRTMHNRLAPGAESRDLTLGDAAVIAPLVVCILALALYPQQAMTDSERSVKLVLAKGQRAVGTESTIASLGRASP
jgi:NADH-quinone oxidoreductase subunit M